MTSITPHRDATIRAIAQTKAGYAERMADGRLTELDAHLRSVLLETAMLKLADELDREVCGNDIANAFIGAFGDAVSNVLLTLASRHELDAGHLAYQFLETLCERVFSLTTGESGEVTASEEVVAFTPVVGNA